MNASTPRKAWWLWALLSVLLCTVIAVAIGTLSGRTADAASTPTRMWFGVTALQVTTGKDFILSGGLQVTDSLAGRTVAISTREVGQESDTPVADAPLQAAPWGNTFNAQVPGMRYSGIVTAAWAGDGEYLPASSWTYVGVRAKVGLRVVRIGSTSVKLQATITPAQPQDAPAIVIGKAFLVSFQRKVEGRWRPLPAPATISTDFQSRVTVTFGLKPGHHVLRARFVGTKYNLPAVSKVLRVTVP